MSIDVDNIEVGFVMMYDLWVGVFEFGIGLYFLLRYVGVVVVFIVVFVLCKLIWRKVIVFIILLIMLVFIVFLYYFFM